MHPHSKHWHLIDYAIVWRKDRQHAVSECQSPCVEQTTRQIIDWLSAYSKSSSDLHGNHKTLKLQTDCMSPSWRTITRDNFPQWYFHKLGLCTSVQNLTVFRNAFHSSAVDTLGQKSRKHQDWLHENGEEINVCTRHINMILAQYPIRQTTTTFLWLERN